MGLALRKKIDTKKEKPEGIFTTRGTCFKAQKTDSPLPPNAMDRQPSCSISRLYPQSSSAKWGDTRAEDTPAVISTHAEQLPKRLPLAAENGASVAVIDTAPHTQAAALDAARAADLMIIPCKPDLVSIQAIGTTINLVHLAKVPARIVLNGVTHYGTLAKQAREGLRIYDIPCAPVRSETASPLCMPTTPDTVLLSSAQK